MAANGPITVFIGHDSRESACSYVAAHSILRHTRNTVSIKFFNHVELRRGGWFCRPWLISPESGEYIDLIDGMRFNTEYSHTRFLTPALGVGWTLYMDGDIIFQSDIKNLFKLCDDKYAVMCVKHRHQSPQNSIKLDGKLNLVYQRKNWSSFVLYNCNHPSNRLLTKERVNYMKGIDMHSFSWLKTEEIGEIPFTHNFISGVSPRPKDGEKIESIHYTEGGPWNPSCKNVMYADNWIEEYEEWQREADHSDQLTMFPTTKYDRPDPIARRA